MIFVAWTFTIFSALMILAFGFISIRERWDPLLKIVGNCLVVLIGGFVIAVSWALYFGLR